MRVAAIEGNEDHDATWFYGHIERIDFHRQFTEDGEYWCEATVHVPCRHLQVGPDGRTARCAAHGFTGTPTIPRRNGARRRLGRDRFILMDRGRLVRRHLPPPPPPVRQLPVVATTNPCATAACHTSDGTRKAACCRDLQVDVRCGPRRPLLEARLRHRKSPYLCKVTRDPGDPELVNAESISACGYLGDDGIHCDLHGRRRADGRPAKPLLCSAWPESREGLHPGCVFQKRRGR